MGLGLRRRNQLVETRTTKPTLMTRLRGRNARTRTVKTTTKIEPSSAVHGHGHGTAHHAPAARRSRGWGWNNRRVAREPVVHRRRHVSFGDKISGAMLRLKGSLTHRPRVKAAGARRMHGTEGHGGHHVY